MTHGDLSQSIPVTTQDWVEPVDFHHAVERRWLLLVVVLALTLRLAAVVLIRPDQQPSTFEYGVIARSLVDTGVFGFDLDGLGKLRETSFMPPLYPLVMAATMAVAGDQFILALRLLQTLLSTLGCLFTYGIAKEAFGRRDVALAAAIGAAIYPPFVSQVLHTDTVVFDVVLLQGYVLFGLRGIRRDSAREVCVAGLFLGLASLTRSSALICAIAVPVGLIAGGRPGRTVFRLTGILLVGVLMLVLPWSARNTVVQGSPTLISTNGGINLWIGNHRGATGEFDLAAMAQMLRQTRGMRETERDALFYQLVWGFVRQQPAEFLELLGRKLAYFVWFRPGLGAAYAELAEVIGPARIVYVLSYALILPAALAGLIATRRLWRRLAPVYAVLLTYSLVSVLFFVATRYRAPLEAYLIVFAAYALSWIGRLALHFVRRPGTHQS